MSGACSAEFPALPIEIAVVSTDAPNAKAGVLAELARRARYPVLLVNDSDITVDPGYLDAVTAPLEDPRIGLVTCLYRAEADSPAARLEALGIATEFAPSVLVARLLGVAEFALGSTMAFRAEVLRKIGGFEAIDDYIADDYQLGLRISRAGLPHPLRAGGGGHGPGRRVVGRGLAAPVALVAHHPGLAAGRLLRLRGDTRHLVGAGGLRRRPVVGRRAWRWPCASPPEWW